MSRDLIDAITAVMVVLYGSSASEVSRTDLRRLQGTLSGDYIERAIEKLRAADLLVPSWVDGVLKQTGPGLNAYAMGTYLALSLGKAHIIPFSGPAIVHVIVEGKKNPETGSTGFYCAEAGNRLVTAAHNVSGRRVLRIVDSEERVIHRSPIAVHPVVVGLDLAIIDIVAPAGTPTLHVEWDKEEIVELKEVYIAGFPQIPQQGRASKTWRSGEIASINMDYQRRTSYLTTNITSAGFSGGPAINERGRVIGVVAGEPDDRSSTDASAGARDTGGEDVGSQHYDSQYSVLTPAWYIRDLLERHPFQ